jgi:putative transposase
MVYKPSNREGFLMARPIRIEYEGAFYHVTSRGNERKRIFSTKTDYHQFKSYLKRING